MAYSPLGRGFLAGRFSSSEELDEGDFRRYGPRFTGANGEHNRALAERVRELAQEKGVTPGPARTRVGAEPWRARRPDPRYQAPSLSRGEPRRRRGGAQRGGVERIADAIPAAAGRALRRAGDARGQSVGRAVTGTSWRRVRDGSSVIGLARRSRWSASVAVSAVSAVVSVVLVSVGRVFLFRMPHRFAIVISR